MNKIKEFNENGFCIAKSIIPVALHKELFLTFYDLVTSMVNRHKVQLDFDFKDISDVKYPDDIDHLDKALFAVSDYKRDLIGELYDTIAYCSAFLKLVSHPEIENNARELLSLKSHSTIYSTTHRIRMDEPEDVKRRAGWHQEIFHTYPDTKFIQTWAPVIRDSTVNNGTIEVCEQSHLNGVVDQIWEDEKGGGYAHRILVKDKIVQKHKEVQLPMKVGDVMFFDPHLIHRSGYNSSNEIRYSQVGMWNDCSHNGFITPKPAFFSRSDSPKENYDKHMAIIRKQ